MPDLISQFNAILREYISLYHARFCNHNNSHLEVNGLAPSDNSCSKHEYTHFRDLNDSKILLAMALEIEDSASVELLEKIENK
jgi:hypothetical protein